MKCRWMCEPDQARGPNERSRTLNGIWEVPSGWLLEHKAESLGLPVAEELLWAALWDGGGWEIPVWKLQMVPFDNSRDACWGSNKSMEGQAGVMLKWLLGNPRKKSGRLCCRV